MTISEAMYMGQQAIIVICMICGPILLIAMAVGLVVSLFQTVTQIQEMTLTFVPKIAAVFIVMAVFGPWMFGELVEYARFCFESVAETTR